MYEIVFLDEFRKGLKKVVYRDPRLLKKLQKTLLLLNTNISHRSLRLHKIAGLDYWSISVNESYRIKIKIEDKYIFLLKFGKHEDIY